MTTVTKMMRYAPVVGHVLSAENHWAVIGFRGQLNKAETAQLPAAVVEHLLRIVTGPSCTNRPPVALSQTGGVLGMLQSAEPIIACPKTLVTSSRNIGGGL